MPALDLPTWADLALKILAIAVVALLAILAVRTAGKIASRELLERRMEDEGSALLPAVELERRVRTIEHLAVRIVSGLIVIVAVLMALSAFDIEIGPAIAGLGVVGIAVGLGAQTLVKDWLAGVFIILENQYNRGDVVRIAGVSGLVEDFSLRRTTLRDLDGTVHVVPNGQIAVASNMTRLWARVNLDVSVAYDTDIDAATRLINAVGEEMHSDPDWSTRMLETPTVIRVDALGDSGVTLKVLGQVRAAEQWAVAGELRKRILAAFGEHGIEIPFPHRVIVNRTEPAASEASDGGAPSPDASSQAVAREANRPRD